MNSYVAIRPLNSPSNAKVNINFHQVSGTQFYAGTVRIGYTDTGTFYSGTFNVGDGTNTNCSNCRDNGIYEAAPNFWTTINGKRTFFAYVQDQWGSLIIVMEDDLNAGDGQGGSILRGRIYYRNFATQSCQPNPYLPNYTPYCGQSTERKCWYIYSGPYACYSNNMSQKLSSTDFSDGTYRLLGSFSGVRSSVALGN